MPPNADPPGASVLSREPHLFRFGLRQLFMLVSGFALLFSAMAGLGLNWGAAVGFIAALVAAHVLATVIGTRLRDSSGEIQRWRAGLAPEATDGPPPSGPLSPAELASLTASSLASRDDAPWRSPMAGVAGLLGGAFLGAAIMPIVAGAQVNAAGLALGAVSVGVICGWLAIMVANFSAIARRSWREARAQSAASRGVPAPGDASSRAAGAR